MFDIKKRYAIWNKFKKEYAGIPELPGIYLWTRKDTNINKTYFYIGQAKNLLKRRFDYYLIKIGLTYPTRHFESSLKTHDDWEYMVKEFCSEKDLDEREKYWIDYYMKKDNYITRNESLTGKDVVKSNAKRIKKIEDMIKKSIENCLKKLDVEVLDDLSIIIHTKRSKSTNALLKTSQDAMKKLKEILGVK